MDETFDISALVTAWGATYTDEGQTAKDIRLQLFERTDTKALFKVRPTTGDTYKGSYSTISGVLQAFAIPFSAQGKITFKPCELKLGEFKIDYPMVPDELRSSYEGFLVELEKEDRTKWGIIKWAIMHLILPKAHEEFETQVAWRGWQRTSFAAVPATPNVDGTTFVREISTKEAVQPANAAMDGIWIQIIKNLARINVITKGALPTDATLFCTFIEEFVAEIESVLRSKIDFLFMSEANYNLYREGRRLKYNVNYASVSDLTAIKDSNIKVNWIRGMDGSDKIWGTPADNRILPRRKANSGKFSVQGVDREVKLMTDWKEVIGFEVPEYVVTNDLENTITAQNITDYYTEPA